VDLDRWQRIEGLFHSACEQEASQRAAFLEQACGGDELLRREVMSLLTQSEGADSFLEAPAMEMEAKALALSFGAETQPGPARSAEASSPSSFPTAIGRYRIVRLLGEGGMGGVYEAEQEQPRRSVALKVIKPGLCTPEGLWRFEHESQALGRLQHPGIAQIYEAGSADTGFGPQPYFAMELVRGKSLMAHVDAHQLSTRQRLALMVRICDAVNHAHQRGLIHRDLKPGNILVDEAGQPKVLDFGVARLAGSDVEVTRQTSAGQIVGTLSYMSPEQVLADPLELDIRSDVYSLGVILYELLSGRLPYNVSHRKLPEALRTIREDDPTSLSSISRTYRGDIETIVGKALEKDKTRRYASAADLSADIQRYLGDEPIAARPPSAGYQLQKFARRHRALVGGIAAVFVVLVAGIIASTSQAIRANRAGQAALVERDRALQAEARARVERDRATAAEQAATRERNRALTEKQRADDEAATAKAVNNFLQQDLLAQASAKRQARPDSKPDPDLKVRTALERAAAGIKGKFDKQPLVEASIRQTIGMTYRDLGLYPEAQPQLETALSLRRRLLGEDHPDTLASMGDLAVLYRDQSKPARAELLLAKLLNIQRRVLGEDAPDTLESAHELAQIYEEEDKNAQAEPLLTKTLRARRRILGEDHPDTLLSMIELGGFYQLQGKYTDAEHLVTKALAVQRRVLGDDHPETLASVNALAVLYATEGKYAQAEPLYLEALAIQRRVLGEEHSETLITMNNLASLYRTEGKYAEAEPLQTRAFEVQRRVLGEEHGETLASMNNLAVLYQEQGRYAQAEPLLVKGLEIRSRVHGESDPDTVRGMNNLAVLYGQEGKYAQAEPLMAAVLAIRRRVLGEEHPLTLLGMSNLAKVYQVQGKYAQAEPLCLKALEVRRRVLGEEHPDTLGSVNNLGTLYRCEGKYAEAESLLTRAVEVRRRVLGAEHPSTLASVKELAGLKRSQGNYAGADALFTSVLEARRRVLGPSHPDTLEVMTSLGEVHLQQKRYADAEPLLREALTNYERTASDSGERYRSQSLLGASLAAQRKYAEAEPLIISGYEGMTRRATAMPFEDRPIVEQAADRIVQLYESWGKPEKAAEWREKRGPSR
jgi:tetratricopeptide (TPR) repeat protein